MFPTEEKTGKFLKIAIAHDYLTQRGGAERVVLSLHRAYPDATIYTTLYDPEGTFPEFQNAKIVVSPLNAISIFRKNHRLALPFLAAASSLVDIDADVVIASSSGWAHGFGSNGVKVTYCHTPARWLYLPEEYLGGNSSFIKRVVLGIFSPVLKAWDQRAAKSACAYIANSTVVQKRILDVYSKHAPIVFPPHSVDVGGAQVPVPEISEDRYGKYLLVVSRLMPYKNVDKVIEAAKITGQPLVVVGSGPEKLRLLGDAGSETVLVSDLSEEQLRYVYAGARMLVAASFEDFGITPLESAAWGIPTLALRAGGYLDTVIEGQTGLYFDKPDADSIADAVRTALNMPWDKSRIVEHSKSFNEGRFIRELNELLGSTALGAVE